MRLDLAIAYYCVVSNVPRIWIELKLLLVGTRTMFDTPVPEAFLFDKM